MTARRHRQHYGCMALQIPRMCPTCGVPTIMTNGNAHGYCSDECKLANHVSVTETGCWEWTGQRDQDGYGRASRTQAHRLMWRVVHGTAPGRLLVRHKCDNPPCVNPDHLELGTQQDNMDDCVRRGRSRQGVAHHKAILTDQQVQEIRSSNATARKLAIELNVSVYTIYDVRSGKNWSHVG